MTTSRLQPHHLEDVRSSGLLAESLAACGRYSPYSATEACTRELLGFSVGPGLVFPYPGTEDERGIPFCQVKPDKKPEWMNGAKYLTPKDGGCRVYVPPILPADRLRNPRVPLYVTEGCKKALKACQEGLVCIALAGVDAWKDRSSGKSAPIPDLDKIAWTGRTAYIVYDSDLATKPAVRFAEFRLGRELHARGAEVFAVHLPPGPNGEKVGLDDYLCSHSVEALCEIEPEPIQHPAKEETRKARTEAPPAERVTREGDDFRFAWPADGITVELTRLRDQSDGVQGEIAIALHGHCLHWARINLASLSARESLVTKLGRTQAGHPWRDLLEQVCREAAAQFRASAPTVQLQPVRQLGPRDCYLMNKLVLAHETNVLFADGGSGKSELALALGVATATGKALAGGLTPYQTGPVVYLDWESCQEVHEDRLAGLLAGVGGGGPVPIYYRRMVGALADDMTAVRQDIARLAPVLIIVDSAAPACGAEPEGADAAIRLFNALHALAPARLVLAHVSKLQADQRGAARPFGSVFVQNLPRNVWELRKAEEDDENTLTLGLFHRKTNRGRLLPPFGLRFTFEDVATQITSSDVSQDAALRERAGLPQSIKAALRAGSKTIADLAEELEAKPDTVQKALYRLEKASVVMRIGEKKASAPGQPITWGLTA